MYKVRVPLVGLERIGSVNPLAMEGVSKHIVVAIDTAIGEAGETRVVTFDFLPEQPESIRVLVGLLAGEEAQGK